MKTNKLKFLVPSLCFMTFVTAFTQVQDSITIKTDTINTQVNVAQSKEEKNRNVMLNATDNTGPRDVNIGLPASVGGITILENDLPVVYYFWPELFNRTWRQSVSLEKTGLLKMEQVANNLGELGYAVNSYTQSGTKNFKFKGKVSGSHFGWLLGDINVSGPISKNGWAYSAGIFLNFDPSTYNLGFNQYTDQTKIFRAGLTKYFKNNKGKFNVFYKYANSYSLTNYAVFEYGPNGEAKELDNFTIGRDSYVIRDGVLHFKDVVTGEDYSAGMDGLKATTGSHNLDFFGNYVLNNGWNFKYSTRFHLAKASLLYAIPISIFSVDETDGYTIASSGENYSGNVGTQLAMGTPNIPTTTFMANFSLNKDIKNHKLSIGILERYYNSEDYRSNRSFFFQTVEDQPRKLITSNTDENGFYNYNVGAEYNDGIENKFSFFGTDTWQVNEDLILSYGINFMYEKLKGHYYLTGRTPGLVFDEADKMDFDNDWLLTSGSLRATYNITNNFGLLANALYTEYNGKLGDYSGAVTPGLKKSKSPLGGAGIFLNNKFIQLVSQVTYLTKDNYMQRFNLVNPNDNTESQTATVYYNIQTIGWTSDIVLKPFKGFNLHYLITFQDPVYKSFTFTAFGNDYDYSDNNVLQISKVLMEIDPSYIYKKWRFWLSFRYFSKQYANLTNALYFKARWETFGGINYKLNDHISFGTTVVNFLNQRGAKGTINGAELITGASQYYGRLLTGSYIRPFTIQASVNLNF